MTTPWVSVEVVMTRIEKMIIGITVVVLGVASMALMWTSRQVGQITVPADGVTETTTNTPRAETTNAARVAPPPPVRRPEVPSPPVAPVPAPPEVDTQVAVREVALPEAPVAPQPPVPEVDREQRNEAMRSLHAVEAQLATGNTDGVDEALQTVSAQLDEPARGAVEAARTALENKDLTLTRDAVIRAIAAAR